MKVKNYKILILVLLLFFLTPLLISFNKSALAENNNQVQNKNYYKRTEQIINYEFKEQKNYMPERIIKGSSNYYRNSLSDANKLVYDNLVKKFLEIDFTRISSYLTPSSNLLKLTLASDATLDNIKLISNYFLLDNPGLFFIKKLEKVEKNSDYEIYYEVYNSFKDDESLLNALKEFILKTELIKEDANTIPFLNNRLFHIFDKVLSDKFNKVPKKDFLVDDRNSAYNSIGKDKKMSKDSLVRLISYIASISDIKNIYISGEVKGSFTSSILSYMQDKFFYLDIYNYLKDKKEKYIHRYFLNSLPSDFTNYNNILNKNDIADKSFNEFYKNSDGYIEYSTIKNRYKNRIKLGPDNSGNTDFVQQGPMSNNPYDNFKAPFSKFYLPSKPNFRYEYFYQSKDGTKSKTLPSAEGEYIYYLRSLDSDSYFEVKIRFKIAEKLSVLFKDDLGVDSKKPRDVSCFKGDYVIKPEDPKIDGYVFEGYLNNDLLEKPILNSLVVVEKYRKPRITFFDEDGKENNLLKPNPSDSHSSNSILKNVTPIVPEGHIFIGYKIKGTNNFIGTEFGNLPITSDIELVAIISKIELNVKGSLFRHNKKVKDKVNTFRIHPKNRIPDLTRVKFGSEFVSATGIKFSSPFDQVKTLKEYDVTFIAKSKNSYDERLVKAHLIVDDQMFFTFGWLKKYWWLVILIIILIIFSPFLIRILFKIIKKIRKAAKRRRKEKKEKELENEINDEEKILEKQKYLNSLKNNNNYINESNKTYDNSFSIPKNNIEANDKNNFTSSDDYKTSYNDLDNYQSNSNKLNDNKNDYFNSYTPFIEDYTIDELKEKNESYGDYENDENK